MISGSEMQELYNRAIYLIEEIDDISYEKRFAHPDDFYIFDDNINNKKQELALIKQTIENYGGSYD